MDNLTKSIRTTECLKPCIYNEETGYRAGRNRHKNQYNSKLKCIGKLQSQMGEKYRIWKVCKFKNLKEIREELKYVTQSSGKHQDVNIRCSYVRHTLEVRYSCAINTLAVPSCQRIATHVQGTRPMTIKLKVMGCANRLPTDSLPTGLFAEWASCRMDILPNGHLTEWASCRMGILPNGHLAEWASCRMGILPNGHLTKSHFAASVS
ncbi:hypothetical protein GQR58_025319 [Nymphon striatum]|nr:hypothetical protein GQR58_025319 [Nymphon striatum]